MPFFDRTPLETSEADTIVAISTPPGRGGIGIVRMSGPEALVVADQMLKLSAPLDHARARQAWVMERSEAHGGSGGTECPSEINAEDAKRGFPSGMTIKRCAGDGIDRTEAGDEASEDVRAIDEAVVTAFHAPRSYTGEDVVEIAAHGSPVVLRAIVQQALEIGARLAAEGRLGGAVGQAGTVRLARAGEFTERAFLSGRLDLTQAEAVQDLIAAQTLDQARVAAQQMGGAISRRVGPAKESLLTILTLLEAGMDFASGELDDVEVVAAETIAASIRAVREPLEALAGSFRRGQLLREGAAVALIGPPNAGKSSLFNRLLERERSIVTALPGTTRDTVEEAVSVGGVPLRLIDTAGLRMEDEAADVAEQKGMERSREALAEADLVLLVHDATQPLGEAEATVAKMAANMVAKEILGAEAGRAADGPGLTAAPDRVPGATAAEGPRPYLLIYNKMDLLPGGDELADAGLLHGGAASGAGGAQEVVRVSALTGFGFEDLRRKMLERLGAPGALADAGAINNLRQQEAVMGALAALGDAATANEAGLPHELILMDLHRALRALDSLTGATTAEDILARIFATFCIGK